MAYAVKRAGGFAGYYRDMQGKRCSAGIFPTEAEAIIRARDREGLTPMERAQVSGTVPDVGTYAMHFEVWLVDVKVNGGLAPRSWMSYECNLRRHVLPIIGDRPVASLNQKVIRVMFAVMTRNGVGPHVRFQCKCAIGRSLRDLVPSVLAVNPTHGIQIDRPPTSLFALLTPGDVAKVWAMLTDGQALFAAVLISTGACYGEGSELRVKDIDFRTRERWIRRRVTVVNGAFEDGCRYAILHGTKSGMEYGRSIGLTSTVVEALRAWVDTNGLAAGDLQFPAHLVSSVRSGVDHETIGGKEFTGMGGMVFFHGTAYGYVGGKCRCDECMRAWRSYKGHAKSGPGVRCRKPGSVNLTGHMSADTCRTIWHGACDTSPSCGATSPSRTGRADRRRPHLAGPHMECHGQGQHLRPQPRDPRLPDDPRLRRGRRCRVRAHHLRGGGTRASGS